MESLLKELKELKEELQKSLTNNAKDIGKVIKTIEEIPEKLETDEERIRFCYWLAFHVIVPAKAKGFDRPIENLTETSELYDEKIRSAASKIVKKYIK